MTAIMAQRKAVELSPTQLRAVILRVEWDFKHHRPGSPSFNPYPTRSTEYLVWQKQFDLLIKDRQKQGIF